MLGHGNELDRDSAAIIDRFPNTNRDCTQMVDIACGKYYSMAISDEGRVYSWGRGESGVLGHGNKNNLSSPVLIESLLSTKIIGISCGVNHTAAISGNG